MLVVNLYGAPGAGKSTGAAYIFSKLKMAGVKTELVTEFAKDMVWEENNEALHNQMYMFGQQYFRLSRLKNKVDVVITDSPILLSCFYAKENDPDMKNDQALLEQFSFLANRIYNNYNNLNIFLKRVNPYQNIGRLQNEEESDILSSKIEKFLTDNNIDYQCGVGSESYYNAVIEDILCCLKEETKHEL